MNEMELRRQLKPLIAEMIEVDNFEDDEKFVTGLGVDSMMALEMVARIEKQYRIRIPEQYFPEMKTFNDVTRIVMEVM
jgi:acyl carrier protein